MRSYFTEHLIYVFLTQNLPVACMSGREQKSLPKQTVAYLDAEKPTRTSDVVKLWPSQTMPYDIILTTTICIKASGTRALRSSCTKLGPSNPKADFTATFKP